MTWTSSDRSSLDVAHARSWFPAFDEQSLDGWAFFENAGGSYACRPVIERLTTYYRRLKVQPYGPYPASEEAGRWMDQSYRALAGVLNVDVDELSLGPSTSQNVYVLARAMRPLWDDGDEIIVSEQDHEANAGPWRRLADTGITVTEWPVDPDTGLLDPADLDRLLHPGVRLVALPHASNVIGHVNPVAEVADAAHRVGAVCVVDGVSYAPHGLPDIDALGVDAYLFSLYKTWGPHLGAMVVRRPLLDQVANQGHWFNADKPRSRLTPAGPDHAQIAATAGVVDYLGFIHDHHASVPASEHPVPLAEVGRRTHDLFRTREKALLSPVLEALAVRSDIRLIGPADPEVRVPTVAFVPLNRSVEEVVTGLVDRQLMVAGGDFYAVRPLTALGVDPDSGVVRVSFVHYTTEREIERLIDGLRTVLG